ncbi:MAG: PilZ domain-containing protein [Candidatus Omnitrophica bacterium]|nr:PilZ domain-containing protein [Candidatus Omnitrophota bacterium]
MSEQERRRFARFNILVEAKVSKRQEGAPEKILNTKNISQGGVCIISTEPYSLGELLNLKLHLPDVDEEITAIGKVVWIKPLESISGSEIKRYELGLEFIGINDETFQRIQKYLFYKQQ